ncbi:MAG: hypothetical protein FWC27_13595 [Firmicutes bacterium]|nr:hypothetical protein [Bacillota bacterium]
MRRKCLALALAVLTPLACAACGAKQGPFQFARRILTQYDLSYAAKGAPVVEPGEVLVFFTYMETFDAEAAKAGTASNTVWAAEAVDHAASLEDVGEGLYKSEEDDRGAFFTRRTEYGFGVAVTETWVLPEAEYRAALKSLLTAALDAQEREKAFWLIPGQDRGYSSSSLNPSISFYMQSYLPERLQTGAKAARMSTELMREYFPFLGRETA